MASPESNSNRISDSDLVNAGYEKVEEVWLPPTARPRPRPSAAAARKAKSREKRKDIRQINIEIPANESARAACKNLAKALRDGQISSAAIESLLATKTRPRGDQVPLVVLLEKATMLTPAQAAYVAGVTVRTANRAVDERILPRDLYRRNHNGRAISSTACPLLDFYVEARAHVSAQARIGIISTCWHLIKGSRSAPHKCAADGRPKTSGAAFQTGCLSVDLKPFCERALARLADLKASLEVVTAEPAPRGSHPKVRGTDLSPYQLESALAHGSTREEILERHPELSPELLELALIWAQAHARRR